jgi:hypothetical protein
MPEWIVPIPQKPGEPTAYVLTPSGRTYRQDEYLAASSEAAELAKQLGVTIGTDLTPLVEVIAQRNELGSAAGALGAIAMAVAIDRTHGWKIQACPRCGRGGQATTGIGDSQMCLDCFGKASHEDRTRANESMRGMGDNWGRGGFRG